MRTNVLFHHPAEFLSHSGSILCVHGAQWFVALLRQVPDLEVVEPLCQEDWGVVVLARRGRRRFWIGLGAWPENGHAWLAHFHHGSFAWLQRFSLAGHRALEQVLTEVHRVLTSEPLISNVVWYEEGQLDRAEPRGFPTPVDS